MKYVIAATVAVFLMKLHIAGTNIAILLVILLLFFFLIWKQIISIQGTVMSGIENNSRSYLVFEVSEEKTTNYVIAPQVALNSHSLLFHGYICFC